MTTSAPRAADRVLETPQGTFTLLRHPVSSRDLLRAWDAADEYLLGYLGTELAEVLARPDEPLNLLVVNDAFGALAVALAEHNPMSWSDSAMAHAGLLANLERNGRTIQSERLLASTSSPPERVDVVVLKVPKSNAQLEDQLRRLRPSLHADSIIVAGGMVKQIHTSTLAIFEAVLGQTRTSLAKKKARLIFSDLDPGLPTAPGTDPVVWSHEGHRIVNLPAVFSASKLDVGTRCFLGALPETDGAVRILDLGCGNGVVGTMAATANPNAEVIFLDESHSAVASAEATFRASFPDREAQFLVAWDAAAVIEAGSVDVVFNNPPFHQHNALGDAVAWDMFRAAQTVLAPGGELWVVGNRHLNYHLKLQRIFGNCETMTGNPKFVVLRAENGRHPSE